MSNTEEYCDHCGDELINFTDRCVVESLPCDIDSANKSESATLCCSCHHLVKVTAERDEMQHELRKAETECSMLRVECGVLEKNAEVTYENHKHIVAELTAERDEAREQAERWEDDALRLMQERNAAERERDDARFTAAHQYAKHHNGDMQTLMDNFCKLKGWEKIRFFVGDDDHAKEGL
jgi:chromosome segregation ATPase